MAIFLTTLGVIVGLIVILVLWLVVRTFRGATKRDKRLFASIEPIIRRLSEGETVSRDEVAALAARPELRYMLYASLRAANRADLLPSGTASSVEEGACSLAYWMMHPNELHDAPELIEHVETLKRPVDGGEASFHVYRYKMPTGHWAAANDWMLGLVGPVQENTEPYQDRSPAFSRVSDLDGKTMPDELVDWYVDMLRKKGTIR